MLSPAEHRDNRLNQMTKPARPRIGITMRIELESDRFYLSRHYSEAVEAAGGLPVHIPVIPKEDFIRDTVSGLDGILLPGSDSDVDPLRYGHQPHAKLGTVHPIKDETDLLVLKAIEQRALPVFAICFGMQVLNVSRGGTLIQDISSQVTGAINHQQGAPRDRHSHAVTFDTSSMLASLAETERALVNSHHHQAVDQVGTNLVAIAWSSDGLIEALEDVRRDRFLLAVQWHPELGWAKDRLSLALFNRFIEACQNYSDVGELVDESRAAS